MRNETAVIGSGQSVIAFKASGIDAFYCADLQKARETLKRLAKTYKVVFVTDDFAEGLDDLIKRMNEQAYPVVVPIPSDAGTNGFAKRKMTEQMERALGVDILFSREGK